MNLTNEDYWGHLIINKSSELITNHSLPKEDGGGSLIFYPYS